MTYRYCWTCNQCVSMTEIKIIDCKLICSMCILYDEKEEEIVYEEENVDPMYVSE